MKIKKIWLLKISNKQIQKLRAKNSGLFFKRAQKHKKGVTEMKLFYASIVWALPISLFLWFIVIQMISILI